MADFQIAFHNATKTATIQAKGDALPAGAVKIGEFKHESSDDPLGNSVVDAIDDNHVFYHHVRDALYKRSASNPANTAGAPNNIQNMQQVNIVRDTTYVALTAIAITPGTVTLTTGSPTQQLGITPTPGGASNTAIATWVSSDPTKATVSATGLVTRVANGSTTITATSVDGARVATRTVTVTS